MDVVGGQAFITVANSDEGPCLLPTGRGELFNKLRIHFGDH